MKQSIIILLFATLFLMSSCGIFKGGKKNKFYSEKGKFKIYFYEEPEISNESVNTELGNIEMHTFMHQDGEGVYMVAFSDYPKALMALSNPEDLLDGAIKGFTGKMGMKITKQKNNKLDNNTGLYFEAKGGGYYAAVQDYIVKNRLYQIAILRSDREPTEKEINDFINSFEFVQ